ncbi:hypothetical protein [Streptosporangium saharense]|uniref:hypothetical protein n=1 Tax=Streptosporangium saharense TaxID=1706840 RepID=UPI00332A7A15
MRRRSPQEKKRLSYAKDRRNDYGENDKSSRRNIRRNKQAPHRANRHHDHQILEAAIGVVDAQTGEDVEARLLVKRRKAWRKVPDAPLGEIVQGTLRIRISQGIDAPERGEARIRRVRQRQRQPIR